MSTRSLVGAETESGIKLVYVHSDGYPDGQWGKVETLRRMVREHGLSKVVSTLLQSPSGWSSFDGNPGEELHEMYRGGRFELVPGFGVRYTLTELENGYVQGDSEYQTPENLTDVGQEFVYVITDDGWLKWAEYRYGDGWDDLNWHEVQIAESIDQF